MVARIENDCKTCVLNERIIALNDMVFTNVISRMIFKTHSPVQANPTLQTNLTNPPIAVNDQVTISGQSCLVQGTFNFPLVISIHAP